MSEILSFPVHPPGPHHSNLNGTNICVVRASDGRISIEFSTANNVVARALITPEEALRLADWIGVEATIARLDGVG